MNELSRTLNSVNIKQQPSAIEQHSLAAFICLYIYTALVLLRPQEIILALDGIPVIMGFT